jgi:parallel beta helix pectate lyase-like protein
MRRFWHALVACAFVVPIAVAGADPAHAVARVAPPSAIDGSGKQDVTSALNAFFKSVPAGTTVDLPSGAQYRTEGPLELTGLHNVTIDGHGATLFAQTDGSGIAPTAPRYRAAWPRLREHITILRGVGLTIRNLTIRGANSNGGYHAALEGQAGIAVYRSHGVVIDNVHVTDTYGDGVYVAGMSTDIAVRQSQFDTIGRQGVGVVNASAVVIERNQFDHVARSVVDLEPASPRWTVQNVHARNNTVHDFGNFLLAAGGAGARVGDIWLEHNRVDGGNGLAVFAGTPAWTRTGLHIVDNQSSATGRVVAGSRGGGVMQLLRLDKVDITGNSQPVASGAAAVALEDVCHLTMSGNSFRGARTDVAVIAKCGSSPKVAPRQSVPVQNPANKRTGNARRRARASGQAAPAATRRSGSHSTSPGWIAAGLLGGGAVALLLLGQSLRRRGSSQPTV